LTRKAYYGAVAGFLLIGWIAVYVYVANRASAVSLTLEIASANPSTTQLFFDTGSGFREIESQTIRNSSDSLALFKRLTFELPSYATIFALRFDPLTTAGTFAIRSVTVRIGNNVLLQIPPEDIIPFNQIAERVQRDDQVVFSTIPGANDAGVTLRLGQPLKSSARFYRVLHIPSFGIAIVSVFAVALLLALLPDPVLRGFQRAAIRLRSMDDLFARIARRVSNPEALRLDSAAIWFCAVCCALFVIATVLNLNGSSAGVFPTVYQHGAEARIWIGFPKQVRADEWAYVTPDILNQVFRADRFETLNSELGTHSTALTGNIPIWHFSTLFRPQYWAFFVMPADYAFAFYWQFKALILVLGTFAWLRLLTGSTFWSVAGSLWYFFSPLTQWAYSWPSALPEMIGFLLLATASGCCLTVETRKGALAVLSVGLAVGTIEFALCSYPPHMIPLFWVAAFFFIAWCVGQRRLIFRSEGAEPRLVAFGFAAVIVGSAALLIFTDLHVALKGIADTVYPGHRSVNGGSTQWFVLLSSFMAWWMTELRTPAALGNICEGSSYLWLSPLTICILGQVKLKRVQKLLLAALWFSFSIILVWLIFPIPAEIGRVLGLDRTLGARLFPALGLANVAILVLCGASMTETRSIFKNVWLRTVLTGLGFGCTLFLLRTVNRDLGRFFNRQEVLLAAMMATGLCYLFCARHKWAFAALLILPQAFVFGRVNPIEQGMSVYLDSDLRKFVSGHPELLRGKWLMFSDSVVRSGFLAATGAQVYTGTHYLPDIDDFPVFAANHLDLNILNRDGYLDAHLRQPDEPMKLEMSATIIVQWDVRPGDAILKQIGIRYVAFDRLPDHDAMTFLRSLSEKPVDGFWLYELR
jgi:hypothetical protein